MSCSRPICWTCCAAGGRSGGRRAGYSPAAIRASPSPPASSTGPAGRQPPPPGSTSASPCTPCDTASPEEIVEIGFKARVGKRRDQSVEDVDDGPGDAVAFGEWPGVGFVLEGTIAVELKLLQNVVGEELWSGSKSSCPLISSVNREARIVRLHDRRTLPKSEGGSGAQVTLELPGGHSCNSN